MEQFGYVCSVYCRQQATQKRIYIPPYALQKSVVEGRSNALAKYITYGVIALVFLLFGFWFWYAWFARAPKVVYSQSIAKPDLETRKSFRPEEFYQLIGPNELLTVKGKQLALMDITEQKQLWSVSLENEAEVNAIKAARAKNEEIQKRTPKVYDPQSGFEITEYKGLDPLGFESEFAFAYPHVIATTNDIWLTTRDHLARFDRQTGARKEIKIDGKIRSIDPGEDAILIVSGNSNGSETLAEISLPDGAMQSEEIKSAAAPPKTTMTAAKSAPVKPVDQSAKARTKRAKPVEPTEKIPVENVKGAAMQAAAGDLADDEMPDMFDDYQHPFVAAGANVVQFQTKLLEHKTISHEAMKPKGKSIVDSGNLTAGQSLDAAQEILNDMKRQQTGGVVEEDVSEYQVTLHRRFAKDVPDWTGKVTGAPEFFALKTVDIVAAGKAIYVFDKNNRKLWEAKLTYSVQGRFSSAHPPCLETKDALYFADVGMLTRFDLANGNVGWRLNSVGVKKIQADRSGNLLVNTTTAGPESIQFSEQINVHEKVHALILDVAPATGKVLWRQESIGDDCLLSGKFLYATKISIAYAALRFEQGPDTVYTLRLLNPSSGGEIWHYPIGNRHVIKTEVQKNWILLQIEDEVLVLKFFSL